MIRFQLLPGRPADWDERIRPYHTKTLFHESAWLDHVLSIHPEGRIDYFELFDGAERVGYHCALRIVKMMIPIHGSPLGGTGTNFMGPVVGADVDQHRLMRSLKRLFGPRHFMHLELSNPWLDRAVMEAEGFQVQEGVTHLCTLPSDEEAAWATLRSEARNRVRKAEKNGLVVERTDDPAVVDHFHEQFGEVYGKQGMDRPFGKERPRSLFDHLLPAGRLLPLWVKSGDEVLAAGLFPYDERCIYFWGAASWLKHQSLCPNELLHWEVIRFAVRNGIPAYNMCGGASRFKNKFGGEDVPYLTYYKSALPILEVARRMYRDRHFRKLKASAPAPAAG
jgi:hypothetical protein